MITGAAVGSDQVVQSFIQLGLGNLQGWSLLNLLMMEQFSFIINLTYE